MSSTETPPATASVLTLERFNTDDARAREILGACADIGSWVDRVFAARPFASVEELRATGAAASAAIGWDEVAPALDRHPRIGEKKPKTTGTSVEAAWSASEQSAQASTAVDEASEIALEQGNIDYEARFGHIYLVCAAGLSRAQVLADLSGRLDHDQQTERLVVIEELRKIAALRLAKAVGG